MRKRKLDRAWLIHEGLVPIRGLTKEGRAIVTWQKRAHCVRIMGKWERKMEFAIRRLGAPEVCKRLHEAGITLTSFQGEKALDSMIANYLALLDRLVDAAKLMPEPVIEKEEDNDETQEQENAAAE
jgi:hypothetical protein